MPSYDYVCECCSKKIEKLHKMDFEEEVECPDCGEIMEKQFSVTKVVKFKGGGFYCNEYPKEADE